MIKIFIFGLIAIVSGHLIWILSLINIAWLLFKDHTAFSWWFVIADIVVFILLVVFTFTNLFRK